MQRLSSGRHKRHDDDRDSGGEPAAKRRRTSAYVRWALANKVRVRRALPLRDRENEDALLTALRNQWGQLSPDVRVSWCASRAGTGAGMGPTASDAVGTEPPSDDAVSDTSADADAAADAANANAHANVTCDANSGTTSHADAADSNPGGNADGNADGNAEGSEEQDANASDAGMGTACARAVHVAS